MRLSVILDKKILYLLSSKNSILSNNRCFTDLCSLVWQFILIQNPASSGRGHVLAGLCREGMSGQMGFLRFCLTIKTL
jgi:hypothetical protein